MPLEKADVKYFSYHFRKCWNFNVALLHSFQVLPKSWSTLFKLLMQFWENGKWKRSQCSHSLRGSAIHFRNGKSNIQWQVCKLNDFIQIAWHVDPFNKLRRYWSKTQTISIYYFTWIHCLNGMALVTKQIMKWFILESMSNCLNQRNSLT